LGAFFPLRFDLLLDWFYPPRCRFCKEVILGQDDKCFCESCREKIRVVSHPLCSKCGQPFLDASGEDHLCGGCLTRPPSFLTARAWACYPREEIDMHPLRRIVQQFKYGGRVSLGRPLGRLMARGCYEFFCDSPLDCIVPVPLHPRRLRWRGFNQAVILGREVCPDWIVLKFQQLATVVLPPCSGFVPVLYPVLPRPRPDAWVQGGHIAWSW